MKHSLLGVFPGDTAVKIFKQMLTCGLKLVAYHSKTEQPSAEGVFFIAALGDPSACAPLRESLIGYGKTELNVRLYFSRMGGGIKEPEFNCTLAEQTVQIKTVIAALVVMFMAAVLAAVPYILNSVNAFRFPAVQFLKEILIHLLTVSMFPRNIDLQCLVDKIFFGVHNVGKASQGLSVVRRAVNVDMDAAGGICNRPARAKISDELLNRFNIVVYANGRNKLNGIFTV